MKDEGNAPAFTGEQLFYGPIIYSAEGEGQLWAVETQLKSSRRKMSGFT